MVLWMPIVLFLAGCGDAPAAEDTAPHDTGGTTDTDTATDRDTATDTDTAVDTDTAGPVDPDGDGQTAAEGDCDERHADEYRGAPDVSGDGIDSNCDGIDSERFVLAEDVASARLLGDVPDGGGYGTTAGWQVGFSADSSGDGMPDVYAGGPVEYLDEGAPIDAETVWLLAGTTSVSGSLGAASASSWQSPGLWDFGESIDSAGDLDGDGRGDILVGAMGYDGNRGFAGVYLGGTGGVQMMDDAWFAVDGGEYLGGLVTGGLDLDGDGLLDVAMNDGANTVIFRSPTGGVFQPVDADATIAGIMYPPDGGFRDADGDGYSDAMFYNIPDSDVVALRAGPFVGDDAGESLLDIAPPDAGNWTFSMGDVNGDAQLDLAFGVEGYDSAGSNSGRVAFFLGPLTGTRDFSDADAFLDAERSQVGLSRGLSISGDLDGDGDDEIVVGAPGVYAERLGAVAIFADLWAGTVTTAQADIVIDGADLYGIFGWSLATDGDLDGDGRDDLVVGAPAEASTAGSVWLIPAAGLAEHWP